MSDEVIGIGGALRMRRFCGDADGEAAWPWYGDTEIVRLVDGPDGEPHSRDRLP